MPIMCSGIYSNDYIMVPVYSEELNEDGEFDILCYRREYI